MASNNMYKVGDFVFFETSANAPYQIRRIEELHKNPNGSVEAKVTCYYRRRDISSTLVQLADKHQDYLDELEEEDEEEISSIEAASACNNKAPVTKQSTAIQNGHPENSTDSSKPSNNLNSKIGGGDLSDLTSDEKRELHLREIFLSREQEVLPATHIRGKCVVRLANPVAEPIKSYLNQDNLFFYRLVYDSSQKSLLADRGDIRIGTKWQAQLPDKIEHEEMDERHLAQLVWDPTNNLSDDEISQFVELCRAVGTYARANESCYPSCQQSTVLLGAACASRDISRQRALTILHESSYDIRKAMSELVKDGKPLLCMDELESWTASESHIFAEALGKYCNELRDIRADFLPWKTMPQIVEYFRFWKTTDRYVAQRRAKVKEAESQLKQVYIPNYVFANPAILYHNRQQQLGDGVTNNDKGVCESCLVATSPQWYAWGPPNLLCRLCSNCWMYWKKYGGLKNLKHIANEKSREAAHNQSPINMKNGHLDEIGSFGCSQPNCDKEFRLRHQLIRHLAQAHNIHLEVNGHMTALRPRSSYYLQTSNFMRLARRLISKLIKLKSLPKLPFTRVTMSHEQVVKYAQQNIPKLTSDDISRILNYKLHPPAMQQLIQKLRISSDFDSRSAGVSTNILNRDVPPKLTASTKLAFPSLRANDSDYGFRDCLERMSVSVSEGQLVTSSCSSRLLLNSKTSLIRKRDWTSSSSNNNGNQMKLSKHLRLDDMSNGKFDSTNGEHHNVGAMLSSQLSHSSENSDL